MKLKIIKSFVEESLNTEINEIEISFPDFGDDDFKSKLIKIILNDDNDYFFECEQICELIKTRDNKLLSCKNFIYSEILKELIKIVFIVKLEFKYLEKYKDYKYNKENLDFEYSFNKLIFNNFNYQDVFTNLISILNCFADVSSFDSNSILLLEYSDNYFSNIIENKFISFVNKKIERKYFKYSLCLLEIKEKIYTKKTKNKCIGICKINDDILLSISGSEKDYIGLKNNGRWCLSTDTITRYQNSKLLITSKLYCNKIRECHLTDNCLFYGFKLNDLIDIKNESDYLGSLFSCCERKILDCITSFNMASFDSHMYVLYTPCSKCDFYIKKFTHVSCFDITSKEFVKKYKLFLKNKIKTYNFIKKYFKHIF